MDEKPEIKAKLKIVRNDLLIQEYVATRIVPFATVTDEEIEAKFKENPSLIPKEILTLKEIVVKTEKEAQAIYEKLKKGGDFSELVREKSIAPREFMEVTRGRSVRGNFRKPLKMSPFS